MLNHVTLLHLHYWQFPRELHQNYKHHVLGPSNSSQIELQPSVNPWLLVISIRLALWWESIAMFRHRKSPLRTPALWIAIIPWKICAAQRSFLTVECWAHRVPKGPSSPLIAGLKHDPLDVGTLVDGYPNHGCSMWLWTDWNPCMEFRRE